jgi:2'-5' RNA ligase
MNASLQDRYDEMWQTAQAAFAAAAPNLDPHLLDKTHDRRRGATLLIRPHAAVARAVAQTLAELRQLEPDQYYYAPEELHVTVLSLFTGTADPEPYLAQLPLYRRAVDQVLATTPPFSLRFDGLTASPAAILVQGYPDGPQLQDLREALRSAIHAVGLGDNIDRRYRISTAHMTAARFCRPMRDPNHLSAALHALRHHDFGPSPVTQIHLVQNDWYMSHDQVHPLHTYHLS